MPIDYSDVKTGKNPDEVYLPMVGQSGEFKIIGSQRVDKENDPNNFKSMTENYGYHYKLNLPNGKYAILNVFALLKEFQANNVQDGDTVIIDHPGRGQYSVKVKKNEEIASNEKGDLDYLKEIENRNSEKWEE